MKESIESIHDFGAKMRLRSLPDEKLALAWDWFDRSGGDAPPAMWAVMQIIVDLQRQIDELKPDIGRIERTGP